MYSLSRRSFMLQSAALTACAGVAGAEATERVEVAAGGEAFEVGVAVRDITPPPGVPLWGYSGVERVAEGTLSPLYAKAVVFRTGGRAVGLVVLDLGRMPLRERCDRIREAVREAGIDVVVFSATHTHSAPFMELTELPHIEPTDQAIVACLKEAASNAQPARIGLGRATVDIAHNRRVVRDGRAYMMWRNAERVPTSPLDQEAGIIRVDTLEGAPLVTLVNYACHPVILGPDNKRYSADWCGEMCARVEEATGAACLFLQAGAGDINPYMDKMGLDEGAERIMREEGGKAASAVIAAHGGIETASPGAASIAYREERLHVGTRYDFSDPGQRAILEQNYGLMYEFYMRPFAENPTVPLGVLVLNNALALTFVPGEFFVQYQIDLKGRSPLADTFLCGYANEFEIYFPTVKDAAIGGYGASTATYVGLGAGEKLITRATVLIGEMTGAFRPLRGPEDFRLEEYA